MSKVIINGQLQERATATREANSFNCRIGNMYLENGHKCTSGPGKVCKPIEGSFTTECEVKGCNKFC